MSSKYVRFKYTENDLSTALSLINAGQISLNKASLKYGIPKSTLHNKLKEKVPNVRKMGPSTILTAQEEERLVNWILAKAKLGFPMHPEEVKNAVQGVLKACPRETKFVDDRPGEKWLQLFLRRHPEISKRNTEIISKGRASVTEEAIRKWFEDLREYLQKENLLEMINDPSRIFNADETGVKTSIKSGLVLAPTRKSFNNLYEIAPGSEKESITVLCNYAANGVAVPPMTVFPYKRIPKELALSVPKGWAIGRSDSGWMTSAIFFEYVANVFYPWLIQEGIEFPIILFLDGHKSHYNLELYEFCLEKHIILYCLYPNATHILQPCDVAIFRPLKVEWKMACRAHKQKTSASITRHNFCAIFKEAFETACKPSTIINGFKTCGLYPLDEEAVDYSKCISTRRNEIFHKAPENELSPEDYKSSLKVMEHYFGTNKFANPEPLNANDDIYSFWNFCKLNAGEQNICENTSSEPISTETKAVNSEIFTEAFFDDLPMEIDGILYDSSGNTAEINPPVPTNSEDNVIAELESKLECLEILEALIERVFDSVESRAVKFSGVTLTNGSPLRSTASNKKQINVISNITISRKDDNINKLWDKHLHWPKQDVSSKKRGSREQMPFAITSTKWVEYHKEQERKKSEKEDNIRKRKMEKELKKSASKTTKGSNKKTKHKKIASENVASEEGSLAEAEGNEINTDNNNKPDVGNKVSKIQSRKRKRGTQIQERTKKTIPESGVTSKVPMVANEDVKENDFSLGDYVLVLYRNTKYPGVIKDFDKEAEEYEISVMEKNKEDNWIWPRVVDKIWYKKRHVLNKIPEPMYDKSLDAYNLTCDF